MALVSIRDDQFLGTVRSWLQSEGEVFVTIRYAYLAGNKSFEFFSSFEVFTSRMLDLPPQTSVIVFRQRQLPIRGVVDDVFIAKCLSELPDGSEYLVVETEKRVYGAASWFHDAAGESHQELRDDLEDSRGRPVAAGEHPKWWEESNAIIAALVPDKNGVLKPGAY